MDEPRTAREVFDEWGRDQRADGMEREHWPTVEQAFALIPDTDGDYLEVGVGNGYGLRHMATHQFAGGHCWGLDISPSMVERAREKTRDLPNVTVEHGDFLTWRPPDGQDFALIFSMEVFYYFAEVNDGLRKAFDLLEPGGQLWVLVNHYEENPTSHDWPHQLNTTMQLWSMADYRAGFEVAGFQDIRQRQLVILPDGEFDPDKDHGSTLCTVGSKPRA